MESLVSADWLTEALDSPDLVIFDATKYLPNEDRDGRTEFLRAHIAGARYFDIDEVADQDTSLPHMVPTAGRFANLMGMMGVSNASRVVFYDQKGLASAARGWWLMRLFGHDRAAVLDGGLPAWRRRAGVVESGPPLAPTPTVFRPDFRAARLRGVGDMIENIATRAELVLDARAAGRFAGATPEPREGMRSGHMPGAVNLPYADLLQPDGVFRPIAELRARFAAAGVDGTRPVTVSCGSGVTAAILTLGLHLCGLPEGALYDGSWSEWGARSDTLIERD